MFDAQKKALYEVAMFVLMLVERTLFEPVGARRNDGGSPALPRSAHEFWWSARRASGPAIARLFFGGTGSMLVGFDDGTVNEGFLEIGIFSKFGKYRMPDAFLRPSAKSLVRRVRLAEFWRQVAPWGTTSGNPQDSFQK
jgi:hypothetical protein